ncbi:MAG: extracellular solute-binding protein [Pyramidobacter sp.]|jgi:iron(III) transport system substrate-binding protein|nr:extracellular solute-binding protein [Pyramidobacter sp.]MBP3848621.1 extracellular solute-binding protein [Pyramidobacter sp.]
MKKLLALCVLLSMCLCSAAFAEEKLVIYTTVSKGVVSELVPMFEKETGIKVEIVRAGVGELIKRIQSEKDNPLADVLWGSALASLQAAGEPYFEHYVSVNNDAMVDRYKNVEGWVTRHSLAVRCLLVNKNLIGDIPVTGYADLLNPALKGKISHVDPSASSSGYGHLCNMLFAMGGNDLDKGWEYVDKFCANLGNKLLNSSSAVWKGVNDGEYTVGLTYEEVALQSVKSGAPVKIVYMKEGCFVEPNCTAIIKNAKNLENAKKFIDFLTGKEAQSMLINKLNLRSVRKDVEMGADFTATEDIPLFSADTSMSGKMKKAWLAKFKDLFIQYE